MPAVQMNTRIDSHLKTQGDRALAKAGYTPSEAVRFLWSWAAARAHSPEDIVTFFESASANNPSERSQRVALKLETASHAASLIDAFRSQHGISARPELVNKPFDELKEEALCQRYEEKGLA